MVFPIGRVSVRAWLGAYADRDEYCIGVLELGKLPGDVLSRHDCAVACAVLVCDRTPDELFGAENRSDAARELTFAGLV